MNSQKRTCCLCAILVLAALFFLAAAKPVVRSAEIEPVRSMFTSEDPPAGGMRIFRMQLPGGQFRLYLPDYIRPGDRISGSLSYEPTGANTAETAEFLERLAQIRIEMRFADAGPASPAAAMGIDRYASAFRFDVPTNSTGPLTLDLSTRSNADLGQVKMPLARGPEVALNELPLAGHLFPGLAQTDRPLEIRGPFDGDSANTLAELDKAPAQVLIESPRLLVVRSPAKTLGLTDIIVKDGTRQISGTTRNIGVGLSAPKLNLTRGETTVLTVRVEGLSGIRTDVPLWLVKAGTVAMQGGNFQHLLIKPSEVRADGTYETTRTLTGIAQGVFGVVATVIDPTVRPILIPLKEGEEVNGFQVRRDGGGARLEARGVRDPITGKLLDGNQKLAADCGVPVLSKLPIIPMLFKRGSATTAKQDCLIFLTPRIVTSDP